MKELRLEQIEQVGGGRNLLSKIGREISRIGNQIEALGEAYKEVYQKKREERNLPPEAGRCAENNDGQYEQEDTAGATL